LNTEVNEVNTPPKISQKNDNSPSKTVVSEVTEDSEVKSQRHAQVYDKEETASSYLQLVCYFCQKPLMDNDWEQSSFSENKPAHKKCCDEKRKQLKQTVEIPDFEDKCSPPREVF